MENASKALLMAGGILLGILILSGLVLTWTNVSKLQASQTGITKEDQLVQFNQEFETYNGNGKLFGSDIISVMNKIESYNKKRPDIFKDKIQYENIKLSLDISSAKGDWVTDFKTAFGNKTNIDDITTNEQFNNFINTYINYENNAPGKSVMQRLAANVTTIEDLMKTIANGGRNLGEQAAIKEVVGRDISSTGITLAKIREYSRYSQFKSSKFECTGTKYNNETGQINKISFKSK